LMTALRLASILYIANIALYPLIFKIFSFNIYIRL